MNLTDGAETRVANWLTGNTTTAPATPLTARLTTTIGSDSAAGAEVASGSYAEQDLTIGATVTNASTNSADVTFSGMPTTDVLGVEVWDSAGFRWWYMPLSGAAFTVVAATDVFTSAAHGFVDTDKVAFAPGQAPAGLAANTVYRVRDATTNTFKLAAAPGGAALDVTADGSGTYIKVRSTTSGDDFVIPAGDLDLTVDPT